MAPLALCTKTQRVVLQVLSFPCLSGYRSCGSKSTL